MAALSGKVVQHVAYVIWYKHARPRYTEHSNRVLRGVLLVGLCALSFYSKRKKKYYNHVIGIQSRSNCPTTTEKKNFRHFTAVIQFGIEEFFPPVRWNFSKKQISTFYWLKISILGDISLLHREVKITEKGLKQVFVKWSYLGGSKVILCALAL